MEPNQSTSEDQRLLDGLKSWLETSPRQAEIKAKMDEIAGKEGVTNDEIFKGYLGVLHEFVPPELQGAIPKLIEEFREEARGENRLHDWLENTPDGKTTDGLLEQAANEWKAEILRKKAVGEKFDEKDLDEWTASLFEECGGILRKRAPSPLQDAIPKLLDSLEATVRERFRASMNAEPRNGPRSSRPASSPEYRA